MRIVHELPRRLRFVSPLLKDQGMDALRVESALQNLGGVRAVRLNSRAGSLVIQYDGRSEHRQAILRWLRDEFPTVRGQRRPPGEQNREEIGVAAVIGAALGLALLPFLSLHPRRMLTGALIAPVLMGGGKTLLKQGVKVEVLDALAVGLAAWRGQYFTAMATYGLLRLGEYLEHRTGQHADGLLRHLLKPLPNRAWVERDGTLVEIPCAELRPGDRIEVGTGEMIPVDGKVVSGNAAVNQASVTGETLAARKEAGDKVLSGTVLQEGRLRIRATRTGDDTTTARIARFIENSLQQQSKTQCLAEDLANRRVYLTLGLGGLVYALTRDPERLASVFLVDYACALKLGTPVAIKSAMYRGATHGILFRGGQAMENLAEADTFIFDKTGTLTTGLLEVTDIQSFEPELWHEARLLALAASIEEHATHPLAEAVVKQAREAEYPHIEHEEVNYLVAHGLTTQVNGKRVVIGSRHFLEEHEQISFSEHEQAILALEQAGKTLLYIALDGRPLGYLGLRDSVRPEAGGVLRALRTAGVKKLVLLTGDQRDKAETLAAELGMDEVYAECPPEYKGEVVKQLRERGDKVAFIGDGVNDAPALVSAQVGIAMPRGADLARAAADIVLLDDHLETLVSAKRLSNKTMRLIRMHFNVSTGVNTAVISGAALGWINPITSALLHNGATIGVLLNSIAGVSLKTSRWAAMREKLDTLREAYQ